MSAAKTLVGYCDPFSVAPGEAVRLMVSSLLEGPCQLDVVRLRCGDPHRGIDEAVLAGTGLAPGFAGRTQPVRPGSYLLFPAHPAVDELGSLRLSLRLRPSRIAGRPSQALIGTWDAATGRGWALYLDATGAPCLRVGSHELTTGRSLRPGRWAELEAGCETGRLWVRQRPLPSRSPAADLIDPPLEVAEPMAADLVASGRPLLMGAWWGPDGQPAAHFDGRLEAPVLAGVAAWDFGRGIGTDVVTDTGPLGLHGHTVQCPARAVTGSRWNGSTQRWVDDPAQYAAIHLHHDDLVDAGWEPDVTFHVPDDLPFGAVLLPGDRTGRQRRSHPVRRPSAPPGPAAGGRLPPGAPRVGPGVRRRGAVPAADGDLPRLRQPPHDHRRDRLLPLP